MSDNIEDKKKQIIGLYGEMQLSMILHELGWQVHRAYIDDCIDFVISKYWCDKCKRYSEKYIRYSNWNGKKAKCITNLCQFCKNTELKIIENAYLFANDAHEGQKRLTKVPYISRSDDWRMVPEYGRYIR